MLRKNYFFVLTILTLVVFLNKGNILFAQEYDLLIKNAHLIDPKNDIDLREYKNSSPQYYLNFVR